MLCIEVRAHGEATKAFLIPNEDSFEFNFEADGQRAIKFEGKITYDG